MYKVLIVIEAVNNGMATEVVEFQYREQAEDCVLAVNGGEGTGVTEHLVRAVRLYTR